VRIENLPGDGATGGQLGLFRGNMSRFGSQIKLTRERAVVSGETATRPGNAKESRALFDLREIFMETHAVY
jgi:hypothetical protein